MTEINDVIEKGQPIPEDVVRLKDVQRDGWRAATDPNHFVLFEYRGEPNNDGTVRHGNEVSTAWGPLTVTAVREPERKPFPEEAAYWTDDADGDSAIAASEPAPAAALVHLRVPTTSGSACDSDLWQDPEEENPDLWPQSTSDRDKVTCEACRATFTAPADVSPLLDLVRQYGQARWNECAARDGSKWREARTEADAQFGRIAELLAQQDGCGHGALVVKLLDITGVDKTVHLAAAVQNLVTAFKAAQSDPLVLSLPTVPEGAVALVGGKTGRRFPLMDNGFWDDPHGGPIELGQLLDIEDTATPEMAPPREPRTWEPLEVADEGLKVRGTSGNVYAFTGATGRRRAHVEKIGGRFMGCWMSLAELREVDGPLTEVFDEPGGAA